MDRSLYEEHADLERDHWWFVARREIVRTVLVRHLGTYRDRRILDVGCGTGGMLALLGDFGRVEGLEPDSLAVAHCNRSVRDVKVRQGAIPADVPDGGSLDVVTAFDVIEHIDDDRAALSALRSSLRPGGLLVVTVPALPCLWSDHDVLNRHYRRYGSRQLKTLIQSGGFELVHKSFFNTLLLPAVAGARLGQRLRRPTAAPSSDFSMPPRLTNRLLARVMASERRLVAARGLPIGVSMVAIARRRG